MVAPGSVDKPEVAAIVATSLETLIVVGVPLSISLTFTPDASLLRTMPRSVAPLVPQNASSYDASSSWLATSSLG